MILSPSTPRAAVTHFSKHFTFSPHASERTLGLVCWLVASSQQINCKQFAVYFITCYSHFKPNSWNEHVLCRHSPLGLSSTSMVINFFCAFFTHHYLKTSWQPNASPDLSTCRDRRLEQILPFGTNLLYGAEVLFHNWELYLGFRITLPFLGCFELFNLVIRNQRELPEMELWLHLQPNSGCNLLSYRHSSSRGTEI